MRMSCNGCRVLRKGCYENCILRQSLEWICTPEAQANATIFLAKFYGRAGLLNLLLAGPENLRPEIFRSLLYEACGRINNPVYGAVGLMCSQRWQYCEAAVNSILNGTQITQLPPEVDTSCEFGSGSTSGLENVEPSLALGNEGGEVSLELTLGLDPEAVCHHLAAINVSSNESGDS